MTQVKIFFLEIKCRYCKALAHDLEGLLWQAGRPLLCVTGAALVRCRQKLGNMAPSSFSWGWKTQSISRDPKCTGQQKKPAGCDSVRVMPTCHQEILKASLENLRQLGCCFLPGPIFWVSYHPPHWVIRFSTKTGSTVTDSKC